MRENIRFLPQNINTTWNSFLSQNMLVSLLKIQHEIGEEFNPDGDKILRFLNMDINNVKVIILGQNPYPQKGRARGRTL